jgi:HD-GYP domain-containing protein (c-di-GMP phosphodiesterase class II)
MSSAAPVRLSELVAVLSLVSDLGMGRPMEHAMRQCLIALRLGERAGLDDAARECTYYAGLLAWVGCHVDAYEQAKWFGDDHALKSDFHSVDFGEARAALAWTMRHVGPDQPLLRRLRTGLRFVSSGGIQDMEAMLANHWRAVESLALTLGLDEHVRTTIKQTFERWDGKGAPDSAKGEEILLTSRLVNLADVVEIYHQSGGVEAAIAVARERRGTQFDPDVVDLFCDEATELFEALDGITSWDSVIAAAPGLAEPLAAGDLDAALEGIADFTDVKSPYTLGHSRGVSDVAGAAAADLGLDEAGDVRRAALLHDIGRLGVSNAIWDKEQALSVAEAERVRLHPYLTERTLASSPGLRHLGAIAIEHHERMDGSGYPRGLRGEAITPAGRVLAAADMYHAKLEPRPHRPALDPLDAATALRDEVRAGRLDGDAVDAVLGAAGHRTRRRRESVAGLTQREIEVLRLVATGLSNKEVAHQLGIARKTVGNHIEHIYVKIGVTNRALASLFAAQHGLLD